MKNRSIIYIDGFNLYYGAVKNTPWKWLDIVKGSISRSINRFNGWNYSKTTITVYKMTMKKALNLKFIVMP